MATGIIIIYLHRRLLFEVTFGNLKIDIYDKFPQWDFRLKSCCLRVLKRMRENTSSH